MRTALVVVGLALLAGPSAAQANFDLLNGQTLGDTPYRSATPFFGQTVPFNTAANPNVQGNPPFDEEAAENFAPLQFLSCGSYGSKTAWVRFATAVAGRLNVEVNSSHSGPGHDVMYFVWTAPTTIPVGTASHNQLTNVAPGCEDVRVGQPGEPGTGGGDIPAGRTIYVEVASVCKPRAPGATTYQCSDADQQAAPAGVTSVLLRFRPFNGDGDSAPDSIDNCPSTFNDQGDNQDGDNLGDVCDPERDGDAFLDAMDNCPTIPNPGQADLNRDGEGDVCDSDIDGDKRGNTRSTGDCRPRNRRIHRGANEIRGNRRDENCDGKDAPFLRLSTNIEPVFLFDGDQDVLGVASFTVGPLRPGMRLRLECNGSGCPARKTLKLRSKGRGKVRFLRRARRLANGTQVTIKLIRRGFIGRAVRYTIDGKGGPKRARLCLAPPNQFRRVQRLYKGKPCI